MIVVAAVELVVIAVAAVEQLLIVVDVVELLLIVVAVVGLLFGFAGIVVEVVVVELLVQLEVVG